MPEDTLGPWGGNMMVRPRAVFYGYITVLWVEPSSSLTFDRHSRIQMNKQVFDLNTSHPPSNILGVLEWMDQKYGSPEGYMDHIGFPQEQREKIRAALASSPP